MVSLKFENTVLRTGINIFHKYLDALESQVTKDCIIHMDSHNYRDFTSICSVKPMFCHCYLVYATVEDLDQKYLEHLAGLSVIKWIQLILKVRSRELFDALMYHKVFSKFRFLNCYELPKAVWHAYIRYELKVNGCPQEKITKAAVTRIRNRARYKEYVLDSVLPILARTDMSLKTINSYIQPYTGVTLQNIGAKLFDPVKARPVAELLYKYRNYIDPVFKNVKEYVSSWFKLYDEFASGALSDETLLSWLAERGNKYNLTYDYQVRAWLDSFSRYSYEFMAIAFTLLQTAQHDNKSSQLLCIYKLYRMVNLNG